MYLHRQAWVNINSIYPDQMPQNVASYQGLPASFNSLSDLFKFNKKQAKELRCQKI